MGKGVPAKGALKHSEKKRGGPNRAGAHYGGPKKKSSFKQHQKRPFVAKKKTGDKASSSSADKTTGKFSSSSSSSSSSSFSKGGAGGKSFSKDFKKRDYSEKPGPSELRKRSREEFGGDGGKEEFSKLTKKQKTEIINAGKPKRKHYELVTQAKTFWEQIRDQSRLKKDERRALIEELLNAIKGDIIKLINKHDGSRIIQTCMKHGNKAQKQRILEEMKGEWLKLAKGKYSKFFVSSVLEYIEENDIRKYLIPEFFGSIVKLLRHKEASNIVEKIYKSATPLVQCQLVEEFYGREYSIFKTPTKRSLADILKENPEKEGAILSSMMQALTRVMDKNLIFQTISHHILYEYYLNCDDKKKLEMTAMLAPHVIHIIKSKYGAKVASFCVSYATPKERKKIIKDMKGEIHLMCQEPYGYLFVVRLLDTTDDTSLLNKSILQEIKANIGELTYSKHGRLPLLHILAPRSTSYFPKDVIEECLQLTTIKDETTGEITKMSKKDPDVRRAELIQYISEPLIQHVEKETATLIKAMYGSAIVIETILNAKGNKDVILRAICQACHDEATSEEPVTNLLLDNYFSSRVVRKIFHTLAQDPSLIETTIDFPFEFASAIKSAVVDLSMLRGASFAVLDVLSTPAASVIVPILKAAKAKLETSTEKGTANILTLLATFEDAPKKAATPAKKAVTPAKKKAAPKKK